jgi:hypothetical protein
MAEAGLLAVADVPVAARFTNGAGFGVCGEFQRNSAESRHLTRYLRFDRRQSSRCRSRSGADGVMRKTEKNYGNHDGDLGSQKIPKRAPIAVKIRPTSFARGQSAGWWKLILELGCCL